MCSVKLKECLVNLCHLDTTSRVVLAAFSFTQLCVCNSNIWNRIRCIVFWRLHVTTQSTQDTTPNEGNGGRKRHAKVLRGVVIVDLGSCNGTFIEGERVREATLLPQGKLELGHEEVCIEIEGDEGDPLEFGIDATIPNHVPLEQIERGGKDTVAPDEGSLRDERDRLDVEVRRLRKELAERGDGADAGELARLRSENEDLHRRLRSYKEEVEERAQDDAGSVGARLAMERSRELSVENEALQLRVQRLETELAKAHGSNGEAWADEVERLRAENADQARQVSEVQEEIARARKSLDRPSDDAAAAPAVGASELFQRLQLSLIHI